MKRLFVGAVGIAILVVIGGAAKAYQTSNPEYQRQKNLEALTEVTLLMEESGICKSHNLSEDFDLSEVPEILKDIEFCTEYADQQQKYFSNILDAKSERERKRYKRASRLLIKNTKESLDN